MVQHISVEPMTKEQRLEYAERCRLFALQLREEGDILSAELNERMAIGYLQNPED